MILECPSCHARYIVPTGAFASGGRQVRCARCKHQWYAVLPTSIDVFDVPPVEADPEPPKNVEPVANLPALIGRFKWRLWLRNIVFGLLALAILLAWPILDRGSIIRYFPTLRSVYGAAGLHIDHTGTGLVFDQVKSELRYDSGTMRLFVDGVIHNSTADTQFIPHIKARALGPDKHIIQSWWVDPPAATIDAGEDVAFHTEIASPMEHTIEDVYLEFYAQDEKGDVDQ